jgi:cytochrome c biogenesis protein CcmG/thiol:disulfide interchange protein DsbE
MRLRPVLLSGVPALRDRAAGRSAASAAIALVMAGVTAAGGCARSSSPPPHPRSAASQPVGADFRDVVVLDQGGLETTLRAAVAGRPALISFWAPWCAPCVKEQPELERLAHAVEACGGVVIAVAVGETPEVITDFARERHLSFTQLADEHFRLADALGQRRIPTTLVLDRAARILFTGEALDRRATDALEGAIAGPAGAPRCALR